MGPDMSALRSLGRGIGFACLVPLAIFAGLAVAVVLAAAFALRTARLVFFVAFGRAFPL